MTWAESWLTSLHSACQLAPDQAVCCRVCQNLRECAGGLESPGVLSVKQGGTALQRVPEGARRRGPQYGVDGIADHHRTSRLKRSCSVPQHGTGGIAPLAFEAE